MGARHLPAKGLNPSNDSATARATIVMSPLLPSSWQGEPVGGGLMGNAEFSTRVAPLFPVRFDAAATCPGVGHQMRQLM